MSGNHEQGASALRTANLARATYVPIVRRLHPAAEGEEIQLHCSILLIRDFATRLIGRCSDHAYWIHSEIACLATEHAFSLRSLPDLRALRAELIRLQLAAANLDTCAAEPRHHPKAM